MSETKRRCRLCWQYVGGVWTHDRNCLACNGTGYRPVEPSSDPRDERIAALEQERDELAAALRGLSNNVNPCLLEMARYAIGNTNVAVIEHWIGEAKKALEALSRERADAIRKETK